LRNSGQAFIDETLQQFIHGSLVSLERAIEGGRPLTWSTVSEEFMQSPYMELDSSKTRDEHRMFERKKAQWKIRSDGSKLDDDVVREVHCSFVFPRPFTVR
jgi:hypothetical protein